MKKKIWLSVLFVHFFIVLILACFEKKTTIKKRIRVKTVQEIAPALQIVAPESNNIKGSEQKEEKPAKIEVKAPPKAPIAPKKQLVQNKKKKPLVEKKQDPAIAGILKTLEESIKKIDAPTQKKKNPTQPSSMPKLSFEPLSFTRSSQASIEHSNEKATIFSQEDFVHYLQDQLELPDHGYVKMTIVIRRDGSVKAVSVDGSASEKNRAYLEEILPKMHFPFPEIHEKGKNESKITLRFYNEI